jgi:hypothetical protein
MEVEKQASSAELEIENFAPKNILLTGGCGFIGSHVLRHLVTFSCNMR